MTKKEKYGIDDVDFLWKRRDTISKDSGVTLSTFKPVIPWQAVCLNDIRNKFDYSNGYHEVLLSGSVGSAKSIFLAHLIITHCLQYSGACVGVFRMAFSDLKDTIFKDLVDHINDCGLIERKHFKINQSRCQIHFINGASIVSRSFNDQRFTKVRSLRLSMAVFEEFTEFKGKYEQAVKEVRNRLGRIPSVCEKECLLIGATNPDDPSHWLHEYYIDGSMNFSNRHVYYSLTFDNVFLSKSYILGIMRDLDEKQVLRMIFGQWLELKAEVIYYAYSEKNFKNQSYIVNKDKPIHISWDFNIGAGKPLSCCMFQSYSVGDGRYIYHVFDEIVIEGLRTLDSCEELQEKGILDNYGIEFFVHGDASGSHRDTRNKINDYDIIMKFLQNYERKDGRKLEVIKKVPKSNPPIRTRHNKINALCKNAFGETMLFIYKDCKIMNKGLKLTKLKEGSNMIEDDSNDYQHVTTALGYGIIAMERYYKLQEEYEYALENKGY